MPTKSPEALARRIGCEVDQVIRLLDALPATAANARRREVIERYFFAGETLRAIADRMGVTTQYIGQLVRSGIALMAELHLGDAALSVRTRRALGLRIGGPALAEVAPTLDCFRLLRRKDLDVTSLRKLHEHLARRGLALRCGCPVERCSVAAARFGER